MFEILIVTCLASHPLICSRLEVPAYYRTKDACYDDLPNVLNMTVDVLYSQKLNETIYIDKWNCREVRND